MDPINFKEIIPRPLQFLKDVFVSKLCIYDGLLSEYRKELFGKISDFACCQHTNHYNVNVGIFLVFVSH